MPTQKVMFPGSNQQNLAGSFEIPDGDMRFCAIFAHCFTCSKDIAAAARISRSLTQYGIGVLRFDFTGLGRSDGKFAESNFSTNIEDLIAANFFLKDAASEAKLLIGHSLGGAAVLFAAREMKAVKAVATIGAPFQPSHVLHNFGKSLDTLNTDGEADVLLGGRNISMKKQFVDDVESQKPEGHLRDLKKALLIFHSPQDQTVGIENAQNIYRHAMHPKSFISLDGADHLLTKVEDAEYVAATLATWANRYI